MVEKTAAENFVPNPTGGGARHGTGRGPGSPGNPLRLNWRKPGPVAGKFLASRAPVQAIMGPIGSGKTSAALIKGILLAKQQRPSTVDGRRKFKLTVVRDTYRQLWKTTIQTWLRWVPQEAGEWRGAHDEPASHEILFKIEDGSLVQFKIEFIAIGEHRAEDVLRGYEPTAFYLNEADLLSEEVFIYARGRTGRFPTMDEGGPTWHGIWCDFNAPDVDNWTYRHFQEEREPSFEFFRQPSGFSPQAENLANLPDGYYEQQATGQPEWYVRRMIRAEFGYSRHGKPIYPEFNDQVHVAAQRLEPVRALPIKIGIDAGRTPAAIFGQDMPNGQLRILDELALVDAGPSRMAESIAQVLAARFAGMKVAAWCDPAAGYAGDDKDEQSWREIVSNAAKIQIRPAPTNALSTRLEAVRRLLVRLIDGHTPALLVSPNCKVLIKGFASGYRYRREQHAGAERFSETPDKNEFSHPHDALEYLALGVTPYAELMGRATQARSGARQTRAVDDTSPRGEWEGSSRERSRVAVE